MPPDIFRKEQYLLCIAECCSMYTPRSVVHHRPVEHLLHERKDLLRGQTHVLWQRGVVGDAQGKGQPHPTTGGEDPLCRFHYWYCQHHVHHTSLGIDIQFTNLVWAVD